MSESWNALFMPTWMCTIHCTTNQTFPDILHFQGILSFNKICNRQFKSHRHSYLKHPFLWPWQMQSSLVRAFQNAVLMIIFPACCFDLGTPSLCAQLAPHVPPNKSDFTSKTIHGFLSTYLLLIIKTSASTSDWLMLLTFMAACCIFKRDHFCTCFQVAPHNWERLLTCDSHLLVLFWVFA